MTRLARYKKYILVPLAWLLILSVGLIGVELYARHLKEYKLWSLALTKGTIATAAPVNPNFFELDKAKVWNRKFYEAAKSYFVDWPIPLEFFEAETVHPRYLYKPNTQLTNWSSNSWGFRGAEFSVEKPAGMLRIVALGASTTEGSWSNEESYPYHLQVELNRRFPNHKIEVINAGHHAQGILDLAEIAEKRVLPLDPDIIIFYHVANDITQQEWTQDPFSFFCCHQQDPQWYQTLRQYSALFLVISDGLRRETTGLTIPPPKPHSFDPTLPHPTFDMWSTVLRELIQQGKKLGITIVLSSFITVAHEGIEISPEKDLSLYEDFYQRYYPFTPGEIGIMYDHYNQAAARIAQEEDLPFCDVEAQFPKDPSLFGDHIHFMPEGYQMLGELFADCLAEKVLPEFLSTESVKIITSKIEQ